MNKEQQARINSLNRITKKLDKMCPFWLTCVLYSPDSPTCSTMQGIYGGKVAGCVIAYEKGCNRKKGRPANLGALERKIRGVFK